MRSLRARLVVAAALSITLALAVAGLVIAGVLREAVRTGFEARLEGEINAIAAALERQEGTGLLLLDTPPADPRFGRPLSGWYWQVAEPGGRVVLASPSLWNATLEGGRGPDGAALVLAARRLSVPGGGAPVTITVAAPEAALEEAVAAARRPVLAAVALLALALLLAAWVQIAVGLRPLAALRADIAAIRAGRARQLPPARISDVAALTEDLNALLAHDAAMVERARRNAGDLAHGLKTPLAAILNAAAEPGRDPDGVIARAAERMEAQLRHHLQRARIAGAAGVPGARCETGPVLEDLVFLMRRAHAGKGLTLDLMARGAPDFAGARQDLEEMVGNLLDNACKWAGSAVRVAAAAEDGRLVISVADDGPGMAAADRAAALARGGRLDESMPGQGFGLAIVVETAALYGGALTLGDAAPGLLARLTLPAGR